MRLLLSFIAGVIVAVAVWCLVRNPPTLEAHAGDFGRYQLVQCKLLATR